MANSFHKVILEQLDKAENVDSLVKRFFLSRREGIVYGAGGQAAIALECAQYFQKPVRGVLVADDGKRNLPEHHNHFPMFRLGSLPSGFDKSVDVLIGVNEKHNDEIEKTLRKAGFTSIYRAEAWESNNRTLRDLFWENYFSCHNFTLHKDANGDAFYQVDFKNGSCRFYIMEDYDMFRANFSGMLNDTVLPSLLGDYDYLWEGAYEYGEVVLSESDVVFDLGANMGLFSAVAAAKGCLVHAFEPTPAAYSLGILEKNALLYPSISIHPYAVIDKRDRIGFGVNTNLDHNASTVSNSIVLHKGFSNLEVDAISLDEFVAEQNIQRVDFIKADIEGAERLMLQGAKNILARFAPKLALCTYHNHDDPEVMEKLILAANPNYKIEHKWSKLFAYCP